MQLLELVEPSEGALLQLGLRAHDGEVPARTGVERQRQSEVALAGDVPVAHVAQPVLHALAVEVGRPVDGLVCRHQLRAQLVDRDEPVVDDPEDDRSAAAPAVRVAVDVRGRVLEQAALAQVSDDLVGGLDGRAAVQPAVVRVEAPALVDGHENRKVVYLRQLEVLGAGTRRDVDDSCAFVERDLVPGDHAVDDASGRRDVVVRPLVLETHQRGPGSTLHEVVLGVARDCDPLAGIALAVLSLRIHGRGDVGRKRPRRRRPDDQRLGVASFQREAHEERRVGLVLVHVGDGQLVLRERGSAARAPLGRAVALVEPPAVAHRL